MKIWKRIHTHRHTCINESLCCMIEINITLEINYISVKINCQEL